MVPYAANFTLNVRTESKEVIWPLGPLNRSAAARVTSASAPPYSLSNYLIIAAYVFAS
jgi:hypothetical protein